MERDNSSPIVTLGILNAVNESSAVTQRNLADELGIALGLANAYLRRCINKGYVKVRRAPARRYAYYLTPKGFAEKARLTSEYLSESLSFFRTAKTQCSEAFRLSADKSWRRIALAGTGELCEIALLSSRDFEIEIVGIVDFTETADKFAGRHVFGDLSGLPTIDTVIVTDVISPQATYDRLVETIAVERVHALPLLHVVGPSEEA